MIGRPGLKASKRGGEEREHNGPLAVWIEHNEGAATCGPKREPCLFFFTDD